jgi:uncharacterized membrane protein YfhO
MAKDGEQFFMYLLDISTFFFENYLFSSSAHLFMGCHFLILLSLYWGYIVTSPWVAVPVWGYNFELPVDSD